MKGIINVLCVSVCVAMLFVGCAKKPKINLANLRDNGSSTNLPDGPGGNNDSFKVDPFNTDQPAIPAFGDGGNGGANGANGNGGNAARDGWTSMNTAVDAGAGANEYINNPQPWNGKVYFDYNRYEIKASERPVLDKLADFLAQNGNKMLVIEGHCDERGSDEYNRALSERRALAIRDYLKDLGIDVARMFTISYGEDKPEVAGATSEAEHRLNRRGQFLFGDKK